MRLRRITQTIILLALTLPSANALSITGLWNSGVDAAGSARSPQSTELHYSLVEAPVGAAALAVVTRNPHWMLGSATAAWIGPDAAPASSSSDLSDPVGFYRYRLSFHVDAGGADTGIQGFFASDNQAVVYLNGTEIGRNDSIFAFQTPTTFLTTNPAHFLIGANALDFVVYNATGEPVVGNPTGLLVGNLHALQGSTPPHPTPDADSAATFLLLLAGLAWHRAGQRLPLSQARQFFRLVSVP